jgi:hypothetical protein
MAPAYALISGAYLSRANTDGRDELRSRPTSRKWSSGHSSVLRGGDSGFIRCGNVGSLVEQQNVDRLLTRSANRAQQQCHRGLYMAQ